MVTRNLKELGNDPHCLLKCDVRCVLCPLGDWFDDVHLTLSCPFTFHPDLFSLVLFPFSENLPSALWQMEGFLPRLCLFPGRHPRVTSQHICAHVTTAFFLFFFFLLSLVFTVLLPLKGYFTTLCPCSLKPSPTPPVAQLIYPEIYWDKG